ncbi:MAG: hypothetical protein ACRDS0_27325, partial [Pseudonocardiaceae bacterium]
MGRARYHYHYRRGPIGRPFGPLLILCAAVLAAVGMAGLALVAALAVLMPFMLAGVGAVLVIRHARRRQVVRGQQTAPMPARRSAPLVTRTEPVDDWRATRARFAQLRSEYGQFECDPLAVLRLPALADVMVPSTSRFVDAFAEAQALDTDTEPPAAH